VLKRAPLRIDRPMLALVDRFAVEVMGHTDKERRDDTRTVKNDIGSPNYLGETPFWLDYSCDKRGRVYSTSHFNYPLHINGDELMARATRTPRQHRRSTRKASEGRKSNSRRLYRRTLVQRAPWNILGGPKISCAGGFNDQSY
jgi:hypothetical protein